MEIKIENVEKETQEEIKEIKPRGYYKEKTYWSKDREDSYYEGFEIEFFWPFIKITSLMMTFIIIYKQFGVNLFLSIFICLLIIAFY